MPSSKLLKERIESIQDTMKITNAMARHGRVAVLRGHPYALAVKVFRQRVSR